MNDIELIIKLSGSKKLSSDLEKIIFSNRKLSCIYLSTLYEEDIDYFEVPRYIYNYCIANGIRWPEAENIVLNSPDYSYRYRKHVLKF